MSHAGSIKPFTAIWQSKTPHEFDWIVEVFGSAIGAHIFDGDHTIVEDNAILFDAFINRYDEAYYRRFAGKNAFLVHFLDETYAGGYSRYRNFRGVVRKHWSAGFKTDALSFLPLGYNNGLAARSPAPKAGDRSLLWSFAGALGKSTRPDAVAALARLSPYRVVSTDGYCVEAGTAQNLNAEQCAELFRTSVFSPAPMGNVNLECYRTYEALEAGSIPLIERRWSVDYYRELLGEHPIPTFSSWAQAAEFVSQFENNLAAAEELQTSCVAWWKVAKQALNLELHRFLAGRMDAPESPLRWYARAPLWNYFELLRHHDRRAVFRRLRRHMDRFLTEGKYRVS